MTDGFFAPLTVTLFNDDILFIEEDEFEKIYKGEISKSGTAVLPSKRVRQIPQKIEASDKKIESIDEELKEEVDSEVKGKEEISSDQKSE